MLSGVRSPNLPALIGVTQCVMGWDNRVQPNARVAILWLVLYGIYMSPFPLLPMHPNFYSFFNV